MLPVLIAVSGRVAAGKSTLARALAEAIDATCVEADRVHDALLGRAPDAAGRWRGFTAEFEARVYAELLARAGPALAEGRRVVLDACFPLAIQRLEARSLARRSGAAFLLVTCEATDDTVRRRLAERNAETGPSGWDAIHDRLAVRFEPVAGLAADETLRVRGDGDARQAVSEILAVPCLRPRPVDRGPLARPAVVTFDCWNTLLYEADWETAMARRVEELRIAAREAGCEVGSDDARRAFDAAWGRHLALWRDGVASGSREIALWGLAELGVRDPEPAAFAHLIQLFEELSHSGQVLALEGAAQTLAVLQEAGVRCALVCDTGLTPGRVVRGHLDRLGLLRPLASQIFSDEVGVPKPDPRVFRAALAPLGVEPERALHVGDLRRTDVVGARALGMTAVRIRDRHDDDSGLVEADHVVASHGELRALLGLG
jgi:putative hydrolase of the HAD superfamily